MADSANEPATAEKKPIPRWVWWVCGVFGALLLIWIGIPVYGSAAPKSPVTKNLAQGKGIFPALRMYADDNGGHYPLTLSELVPNYLSRRVVYGDPVSERSYDWMYIQGLSETSPANWIVLASPTDQLHEKPGKLMRIVVRNDGSGTVIKAEDFDTQLARQVEAMAAKAP